MILFLLVSVFLLFPAQVWAVQKHSAPEGLYVHQFAHGFYTVAMCYLFWGVQKSAFKTRGWRCLRLFCVFTVLWNITAFLSHVLALRIHSNDFSHKAGYLGSHLLGPLNSVESGYYFIQFDHLFSILSLFLLYLAMKNLYHSSVEEEQV